MSGYAIKNIKTDVEDSAAGRGEPGTVEARFARGAIGSDHVGVSYFRYGPGYRPPFGHRHREQEEVYVVVGGSGRIKLDDEIHEIGPWDVIRVSPQVARLFEAGADGLEVIAVGNDRPEGGDGEMLPEFWPAD